MTIVDDVGRAVELQLRTEIQHVWAGLCERRAAVVDHAVKYGGGPLEEQERLQELSRRGRILDARQMEHDARLARIQLTPRELFDTAWANELHTLDVEMTERREQVEEFRAICESYAREGAQS